MISSVDELTDVWALTGLPVPVTARERGRVASAIRDPQATAAR